MSLARSTLLAETYALGEKPMLRLNAREKWLLLNATSFAISRISIGDPRCASMYSSTCLACRRASPPPDNIFRLVGASRCALAHSASSGFDESLSDRHAISLRVSASLMTLKRVAKRRYVRKYSLQIDPID
jgi:hypothetical protein